MRIGIDCRMYSSSFTGIGRYAYELVRHIFSIEKSLPPSKRNHYVLFFNEPEFSRFEAPNEQFRKICVNARHYSFREQWHFFRILQKENLDLMHFTHFNAPILYTRPSVVTIHDLILSFYPGKKMTKPWHRFGYHAVIHSVLKKSRKIIAVSNHTKYDLMELYRIPEDKIAVIYEAAGDEFRVLDQKSVEGVRRKFELSKPFLLYAGVWRNHKNLVNLIRAFHALRNSYGHDNMLVITGKDDPVYPEIKNAVKELNMEPFVRFTGLVSDNDLIALYNAASVYVHPSFYEGFGLNILEAFACGTPVACSNRSCLPEIAGEGNVLTFNPDNFRDMANVIHHLLYNELLQKQLKERGLQRAKDFSWKKMALETLALYKEVFS